MASKPSDSAILDLGNIGEENAFSSSITPTAGIQSGSDTIGLLDGAGTKQVNYNFWSLSFYAQFFDVDTEDVKKRLIWSVLPRPGATMDFLRRSIRPKPDLYGPFWVCVTLIFSVAISGNVAQYLQTAVQANPATGFRWHYDFHKVTLAATAVFGYAWLVPAFLYATLWWIGGSKQENQTIDTSTSFLELLCVYGYSLAIYIPVSVLWTIQYPIFQWTLALGGAGLSGAVLLLAIWPSVQNHPKKMGIILIGIVLVLHLLLACGFMMYFFHGSTTSVVSSGTEDVASTKLPKPNNIDTQENVAKVSKNVPSETKRSIVANDSGGAKETKKLANQTIKNDKNDKSA